MEAKKRRRYFDKTSEKEEKVEVYNVKISNNFIKKQKYVQTDKQQRNAKKKYPGKAPLDPARLERHSRGEGVGGAGVAHPLHLEKLKKREKKIAFAQDQAARAEILLTEQHGYLEVDEFGKTTAISQKQIADSVDIAAATKIFDLQLTQFGPYRAKYSRNGRHLLLAGQKGHVAAFDWVTKKLHTEINVMESVHDISWLHIETMFAVAQKEWLYIYDNNGTEIHCVKQMDKIVRLEFLPYHFLLAGVNEYGFMSWLDVSIGQIVGHYNNKLGRTTIMAQNPYNATLCLGNSKGVVSIWSPTVKDPLAKILCHKTPVTACAVDSKGMYMATCGTDRSLKVWDIRHLDGPLQHYKLRSAAGDLAFSQQGMLALALGDVTEIYNNCCAQTAERPYLRHRMSKTITNLRFCPFEDVLGIATNKGFTSIIVPGSGEPNLDALEANPYQSKSQRREAEVRSLLDKIPAELITLDPAEVAEVDVPTLRDTLEAKKALLYLKPKKVDFTPRKKKKGKTNIARKKIIKEAAKKEFIEQAKEAQKILQPEDKLTRPKKSFGVLDRFVSNKK